MAILKIRDCNKLFFISLIKENMETNIRLWLKKIGIAVAGIGLTNFNSFASPLVSENFINSFQNDANLIFLRSN